MPYTARITNAVEDALDAVRIDRLGFVSGQTKKYRYVGAMPFSSPGQGSKQRHMKTRNVEFTHTCGKSPGGLHRPDRMRTRRADTYLENIENADRRH